MSVRLFFCLPPNVYLSHGRYRILPQFCNGGRRMLTAISSSSRNKKRQKTFFSSLEVATGDGDNVVKVKEAGHFFPLSLSGGRADEKRWGESRQVHSATFHLPGKRKKCCDVNPSCGEKCTLGPGGGNSWIQAVAGTGCRREVGGKKVAKEIYALRRRRSQGQGGTEKAQRAKAAAQNISCISVLAVWRGREERLCPRRAINSHYGK